VEERAEITPDSNFSVGKLDFDGDKKLHYWFLDMFFRIKNFINKRVY
jgi:hypothetical protein